MAHITGTDRAQVLLLPDTVDDYVGPDNPLTAQIPGLSHRKIRLGPTFHTVSTVSVTPEKGAQSVP